MILDFVGQMVSMANILSTVVMQKQPQMIHKQVGKAVFQ